MTGNSENFLPMKSLNTDTLTTDSPENVSKCLNNSEDIRIFGPLTRRYFSQFEKYASCQGCLTAESSRQVLNHLSLFPTKSQIYESLRSYSDKVEEDVMVFAQFCVLCAALEEGYKKNIHRPSPLSKRPIDKSAMMYKHRRRKVTGLVSSFQVFLGGACNPTTWRADTAIPFLKQHNITFFNPQVSHWSPELIEIEEQAKSIAQVHFFVIHHYTRCIASLVEAAYLAGSGSQLIVVIKPLPGPCLTIMGEIISEEEYSSLSRAHAFIHDLVERQGLPVFTDIDVALKCAASVIKEGKRVSELTLSDGAQPVKFTHIRVGDKYFKIKEAFNAVDTGRTGTISMDDACLAFKMLTNSRLQRSMLPQSKHSHDAKFTLNEFCCLVTEYKYTRPSTSCQFWKKCLHSLTFSCRSNCRTDPEPVDNVFSSRDVFLGGSCGATNWRTEVAIPMLRKHGISYFNPQTPYWTERYIPIEANIKDNCFVLLFIISCDTRATAAMLEAGYYIGLGCDVVLCIENVKEGAIIEDEVVRVNVTPLRDLSGQGMKDYNRGRMYLMELANKEAIQVFDNVSDAVSCVTQRILIHRKSPTTV